MFLPSSKGPSAELEGAALTVIWRQQSMAATRLLHGRESCSASVLANAGS